jgi:hypothetical protein
MGSVLQYPWELIFQQFKQITVGETCLHFSLSLWEQFFSSRFNGNMLQGVTIKFANSPLCACHGSNGQKPVYGLMTLVYQRFTAVLLI